MEVWVITNMWVRLGMYSVGTYLYLSKEEAQRDFDRLVKNCKDAHKTGIEAHDYEIDNDLDYFFSIHHSKGKDVYYEEFYLTDRIVE